MKIVTLAKWLELLNISQTLNSLINKKPIEKSVGFFCGLTFKGMGPRMYG